MKRNAGALTLFLLWIAWLLIATGPFLAVNTAGFRPVAEIFSSLALALSFWLFSLGIGWRVFDLLRAWDSPTDLRGLLSKFLLSCGLGLGILSTAILLVGIYVGISRHILLATLAFAAVLIGPAWLAIATSIRQTLSHLASRTWPPFQILGVVACVAICSLALPAALTPTLYPDTARYHFGLARIFEQMGRIAPVGDFAEANISSNWQMLYLPQLLLVGEGSAQLFNWMALPMIALAVAVAAGPAAWLPSALAVLSTPFILGVAGLANNDLGVTLFAACMWLAMRSPKLKRPLLWAGIFAGVAVGTKYPAGLGVLAFLVSWVLFLRNSKTARIQGIAIFILGGIIGYLPWFVRNWSWTADPFYPVLSKWVVGADSPGAWVSEHYAREMATYGTGMEGWKRVVLAPWRITIGDPKFFESDCGLLLWASIPLLLWAAVRNPRSDGPRIPVAATVVGGVLWAIGPQVTRFLAPLVPGAAIAFGLSWKDWIRAAAIPATARPRFAYIAFALLVAVNLWQTLTSIAGFSDPWHFLLQAQSREQYLTQHSGLYRVATWLEKTSPTSRVLLLGEEGAWFFKNPMRLSGPFDRKWIAQQAQICTTEDELAVALRNAGIEYLCLNEERIFSLDKRFGYMSWPSDEARARFVRFVKTRTSLPYKAGNIHLYHIITTEPQTPQAQAPTPPVVPTMVEPTRPAPLYRVTPAAPRVGN